MRRFLLPLWVLVGLAVGAALLACGHARPAAWVWSAAAAPIAVHVAADALRALAGGRLGGQDPMGPLIRMHTEIETLVTQIAALAEIARCEDRWTEIAPALRRSLFALGALLSLHLSAEEEVMAELAAEAVPSSTSRSPAPPL